MRGWELLTPIAGAVVSFVLIAIGFGAVLAIENMGRTGPLPYTGLSAAANAIAVAACYLVIFAFMYVAARRREATPFRDYFHPLRPRDIAVGIVAGMLCAFALDVMLSVLIAGGLIKLEMTDAEKLLVAQSPLDLAMLLVVVAIIAPIVEEIYFRGLMLEWLARRLPWALSAAITAAIFSAIHGLYLRHAGPSGWLLSLVLFLLGLLNAYWVKQTQKLWRPVATHATYNALLLVGAYFGS